MVFIPNWYTAKQIKALEKQMQYELVVLDEVKLEKLAYSVAVAEIDACGHDTKYIAVADSRCGDLFDDMEEALILRDLQDSNTQAWVPQSRDL